MSEDSTPFSRIVSRLPKQPAVLVTFDRAPNNADEFMMFLDALRTSCYKHEQRFSQMVVTKNMGMRILGPKYISAMAGYMRDHEDLHLRFLGKTAIVVDSDMVGRFLKLVFKIRPPKTEIQVFVRRQDAMTWLGWDKYVAAAKHQKDV